MKNRHEDETSYKLFKFRFGELQWFGDVLLQSRELIRLHGDLPPPSAYTVVFYWRHPIPCHRLGREPPGARRGEIRAASWPAMAAFDGAMADSRISTARTRGA
jgi:hypothetical protein